MLFAMERQARGGMVAIVEAGQQTASPVRIAGIQCGSHLKPSGLVVDILTRVVVDRDNRHRAITVKASIEFVQQIDLKAAAHQFLLDKRGDLQVYLGFGQCDLAITVHTHCARVIAGMASDNPDAQRRLNGSGGVGWIVDGLRG